jgi:hypothetical protein
MAVSHNNYERNVPLVIDFPNRIVASFKYGSYAHQAVGTLYKKFTTQGDIYAMRVSRERLGGECALHQYIFTQETVPIKTSYLDEADFDWNCTIPMDAH